MQLIKSIIRTFILTSTIVVLSACQTTAKTPPRKPISPYINMPISSLLDAYGKPDSITTHGQAKIYVWNLSGSRLDNNSKKRTSTGISSSGTVSRSSSFNPRVIRIYCQLQATINAEQRLQNWQASGEGCRQILYNQL